MQHTTEPIRDRKQLEKMKRYLHGRGTRDYCLFVLGINSGLRVSDLLSLRVKDVVDNDGILRDRIRITEKKTGKGKDFPIADAAGKALKEHLEAMGKHEMGDWLFPSRKGSEPLTRGQAWRILKEAGEYAGVKDNIGTHTMRKTFGYHAYKMRMDLSVIQKLLNHASPAVTLAYIGVTKDDLDSVYLNLNL